MNRLHALVFIILVAVVVASAAFFTVDQRQYALVMQFGEVKEAIDAPGLHVMVPFVQNVRRFDKRILTIDTSDPERFITSEKQNVLVDHFVKWRIIDPLQFYISVAGDESRARLRLLQTVNSVLREEFGRNTVQQVVAGERDAIMKTVREASNRDAAKIGVEILDVRLKRVDLPTDVSDAVYRRMEAERMRVANDRRSQGAADSEKLRAEADRQREVILAEANRESQKIMGEGDAKAADLYAQAYGADQQFYAFYRSMQAYRASFGSKKDILVLDPKSDFFRYMQQQPVSPAR